MVFGLKRAFSRIAACCITGAALLLTACGGGSSKVSSQVVSGVVSAGSTLAGQVELKDAAGSVRKTAIIGANGVYNIDVTGLKAPFLLQAKGSADGVSYELNSFSAGMGTANVNPLTHVLVASAGGTDDPYDNADSATIARIGAGLPEASATLLAELQPLLKQYDAANADPMAGPYLANHTGLDGLFDDVTIALTNGIVTISNTKTGGVIFTGSITDLKNGRFTGTTGSLPDTPAVPGVPTGLSASGGADQVSLGWTAVPNATGYNIYWSTSPGVTKSTGTRVSASTNSFVHSGLSAGTAYYYAVSAVNSAGEGGLSAEATATTSAAPVASAPAAPTGVTATGGTKQVTLSWSPVPGATSYNVYWSTAPGVTSSNGTLISAAVSPLVLTGLADGTNYYYVITAVNAAGEGGASVQVAATTTTPSPTPTAPGAPSAVSAQGGASQVTVSWTASTGAVSYNIYWSTAAGVAPGNGTRVPAASSPFVVTGLAAGTPYYFVVTAVNAAGESPASPVASATTNAPPPALPAAPSGVSATGGNNQVTVTWPAVSGAASYNIYWSTKAGVTTSTGTRITGATSPYLQTGLAAGTSYYYVVTAVNSAGESAPSAEATAATAAPAPVVPAAPTGVTATGGSNQVTVTWTAVSGATGYNLYYSTTTGVTSSNGTRVTGVTTPYVLTGLAASTTYYFVVTAVNAAGEGAASAQVTATTAAPAFDGAAYYTANCAGCHGPLATSNKKGATAAMISAGIASVSGMNRFNTLTAAQIDAIAAALK